MTVQRIVVATGNRGKLTELSRLLAPTGIELCTQSDMSIESPEETGLTFIENALLKARHASAGTGLPALADDSGLAVDALDGAPGIYSARYAGECADDAANNRKLLESLSGVAPEARTARYHCALVLLRHPADPLPLVCSASWEGLILAEARGTGGFGYDPLFFVPSLGLTAAEIDPVLKNQMSHRGRALQMLLSALESEC
jgi:XTP/dITP diphosphohydrolase